MLCPNCNKDNIKLIYKNTGMPYGIFLKYKYIDLEISICRNCSFVFQNSAYSGEYDINIQMLYSNYKILDNYEFPKKDEYHLQALEFLDEFIENKIDYNILEIGSNRGDLLYLLKEKFPKINILGCEPTGFKNLKVLTIQSFFNAKLFSMKFDLIVLRYTLEHIKYPKSFLKEVAKVLKDDGKLYIEVPNLLNSLDEKIEDFTPDHVNYFYLKTLISTVSDLKLEKFYDSPFLYAIFSKNGDFEYKEKDIVDIENKFQGFQKSIDDIANKLDKYKRVIFYGVGNYYLWVYHRFKNILEQKESFF